MIKEGSKVKILPGFVEYGMTHLGSKIDRNKIYTVGKHVERDHYPGWELIEVTSEQTFNFSFREQDLKEYIYIYCI